MPRIFTLKTSLIVFASVLASVACTLCLVVRIDAGLQSQRLTSQNSASSPYLAGRGIADITGEIAEAGMFGNPDVGQSAAGLHMRQRARAFVIVDQTTGQRIAHVTADLGAIFQNVHDAVLKELSARFGDLYTGTNVMLTANHLPAGTGGYSGQTFRAIVHGIVSAIELAHSDLASAELWFSHAALPGVAVNGSRTAFERDSEVERAAFPDGVDPTSATLQVRRGGKVDGVINWFALRGTAATDDNRLITPDSKGYASYHWEREVAGGDYLAPEGPPIIAAFAQSSSADAAPNETPPPNVAPAGSGDVAGIRVRGEQQFESARSQIEGAGEQLRGAVESRTRYLDFGDVTVEPRFTGDGSPHRTCAAALGAPLTGDAGGDASISSSPIAQALNQAAYSISPALRDCQAPKNTVLPVSAVPGAVSALPGAAGQVLPVQLIRIGELFIIGIPVEPTLVAGLRLRQTVAEAVGTALDRVLVQSFANGYAHSVSTPEEYDAQEHEGASTLFGRWQLPAFAQTIAALATAMVDDAPMDVSSPHPDLSGVQQDSPQGGPLLDTAPSGSSFGDVLSAPERDYRPGQQVAVEFVGAHPNNSAQLRDTLLTVERLDGQTWQRVADDGDWSTTLRWNRVGLTESRISITWDIPPAITPGTYRISYFGDASEVVGALSPIHGVSPPFSLA